LRKAADGPSAGLSLVRTWNLIIRVGCAPVVCRISGSGIRKAVLRPIRIMNDKKTLSFAVVRSQQDAPRENRRSFRAVSDR